MSAIITVIIIIIFNIVIPEPFLNPPMDRAPMHGSRDDPNALEACNCRDLHQRCEDITELWELGQRIMVFAVLGALLARASRVLEAPEQRPSTKTPEPLEMQPSGGVKREREAYRHGGGPRGPAMGDAQRAACGPAMRGWEAARLRAGLPARAPAMRGWEAAGPHACWRAGGVRQVACPSAWACGALWARDGRGQGVHAHTAGARGARSVALKRLSWGRQRSERCGALLSLQIGSISVAMMSWVSIVVSARMQNDKRSPPSFGWILRPVAGPRRHAWAAGRGVTRPAWPLDGATRKTADCIPRRNRPALNWQHR